MFFFALKTFAVAYLQSAIIFHSSKGRFSININDIYLAKKLP